MDARSSEAADAPLSHADIRVIVIGVDRWRCF